MPCATTSSHTEDWTKQPTNVWKNVGAASSPKAVPLFPYTAVELET